MDHRTWQRFSLLSASGLFGLLLITESFLASSRWIDRPFPGFFVHENLTVGPYFVPGWSGANGGLQSLDRIVLMDGQVLRNRAELYEYARRVPLGTTIRYQAVRGYRSLDFSAATMRLSFRDWLWSFGLYTVVGWAFLIIGVAPYFYRAASPVALPLCFMVLTVFVWFQTTFDFMTESLLPKELRIFALSLTPSAAIHLALMLRAGDFARTVRLRSILSIYGIGLALAALNAATFFGALEAWAQIFRAGYIYVCIGAISFLIITAVAIRRSASDLNRSRLRVIFVGALLGFLLPAFMAMMTSAWGFPIPYNVALVPTVFFPISVAYALLKYSLFELGNVLRLGLSRVGLFALLVALYASVAFLVVPWIGDHSTGPLVPVFFAVLVIAVFNPLLRWLEGLVDRYIFRQNYDPVQVQQEIGLYLRSLDQGPALAKGFIDRLKHFLGIDQAVVFYRAKGAGDHLAVSSESLALPIEVILTEVDCAKEFWPTTDYRGVTRAEIMNHPRYAETRERLLAVFNRWGAELLMPLVYEREIRGAVIFGAKRSGCDYSAEDFRILAMLTDQLALSLENGRLYQESLLACQRVEAAHRQLVEMNRVKRDFVANICHELRTPVSTIIGFGEALRDLGFQGKALDMLDRLINNGQELSSLMDNLTNFTRMENGGGPAQVELVKLKEILAGLELMTQRLIRQRPIKFGIHMEAPVEAIMSDGQKLQQILVQLLTNALKFTERGKIELTTRTYLERATEFLEIAVADTGIGIKQEDQKTIFEDFRQLDGSSTRHFGGTGVGLALCRKLAAALGGEIRVSSEPGVGSVFSLLLPVKPTVGEAQTLAA
ncbi:MAG TPA: GAF domain-containing sensor histidine kinase [Terriglobales bacterium]|nr:GAF domain-containing sensor histidine kinase [Terriglobales bacterium]